MRVGILGVELSHFRLCKCDKIKGPIVFCSHPLMFIFSEIFGSEFFLIQRLAHGLFSVKEKPNSGPITIMTVLHFDMSMTSGDWPGIASTEAGPSTDGTERTDGIGSELIPAHLFTGGITAAGDLLFSNYQAKMPCALFDLY